MATIGRDTHDIYDFISATGRLQGAAEGKVVIITGGGKGIGKAVARQFALASAAHIFIVGREQSALDATATELQQESPNAKVHGIAADITHDDTASKVFSSIPSDIHPDILINNAGVNSSTAYITDSDPLAWWRDWEVNVKATYLLTREFLLRLKGGPGTIINVSTSVADMVAPNMSAYGTSKLAVTRFTECVQLEYGAQGVRCLCLHPGGIESTGMGQSAPAQYRGTLMDTVELAAGTILYLSTPEAGYLDGRMVFADWDMRRVEECKEEILKDNLLVPRMRYGTRFTIDKIAGLPKGMKLSD